MNENDKYCAALVREADRVYRLARGRVTEASPTDRLIPVDG